jgi:hypothetical protein
MAWCLIRHKHKKAIPATGRGGPQGCETSRLPHFLDNRLTDGGKVVCLTRWSPFTPQEDSCLLLSIRGWVDTRAIVRSIIYYTFFFFEFPGFPLLWHVHHFQQSHCEGRRAQREMLHIGQELNIHEQPLLSAHSCYWLAGRLPGPATHANC